MKQTLWGAVLVKKLNSTAPVMLCAGDIFILEKLLTSSLIPKTSFI